MKWYDVDGYLSEAPRWDVFVEKFQCIWLNKRAFLAIVHQKDYYVSFTHLYLTSHKEDFGKQCRLRSDATERGIWSGFTRFALNTGISIKHGDSKN